jgi:hypothetical protein
MFEVNFYDGLEYVATVSMRQRVEVGDTIITGEILYEVTHVNSLSIKYDKESNKSHIEQTVNVKIIF